jgi:predicted amidohydrolase
MRYLLALMMAVASVVSAQELLPADGGCWQFFAPRKQNAPRPIRSGSATGYRLTLVSGGKRFVHGGFRCGIEGIDPVNWYRFRALALPQQIASLRESVTVQLRWRGDYGNAVAPTYIWDFHPVTQPAGAIEFDRLVQPPPKTRAVDIELILQWTPAGSVTFDRLSFQRAEVPPPREVRVAAVWLRPRNSRTPSDSVEAFAAFTDDAARQHHPDIVVLGETINHVGASQTLDEKAEPVPGPATERLGKVARENHTWVVFGLVERIGPDLFNTGVLLDREGRVAGKYHKVQLPREEVAGGLAPGDSFPVFTADFGKVGIMICHDASFPEAARELALNGAELILVPIWGGRQPLVRARAIENAVWLATSGYDYDSEIIDPLGRVLASVPHDKGAGVAVADIDLSQRFREDWIGDWRDTVNKQRRSTPYRYRVP